jgi:hypothetical protein
VRCRRGRIILAPMLYLSRCITTSSTKYVLRWTGVTYMIQQSLLPLSIKPLALHPDQNHRLSTVTSLDLSTSTYQVVVLVIQVNMAQHLLLVLVPLVGTLSVTTTFNSVVIERSNSNAAFQRYQSSERV